MLQRESDRFTFFLIFLFESTLIEHFTVQPGILLIPFGWITDIDNDLLVIRRIFNTDLIHHFLA
ncbi:MAG: hypothetical protein Q4D17_03675 [Planctomycetia bacterium]|nr:hypothetical protein [Planctomycetia bacterium]